MIQHENLQIHSVSPITFMEQTMQNQTPMDHKAATNMHDGGVGVVKGVPSTIHSQVPKKYRQTHLSILEMERKPLQLK